MQLKYRITLLFTFVVVIILAVFSVSVYLSVSVNRERVIRKRMVNRAITTANLFLKVEEMDTALLNDIQESTRLTLIEKSLAIFDSSGRRVYNYDDPGAPSVEASSIFLKEVARQGGTYFTDGHREAAAVLVRNGSGHYIAISAAYDPDGLEHVRKIGIILLLCFMGGVLVTFVTGYLFALRLVQPVHRMAAQLSEISGRNLSNRLDDDDKQDELGRLAHSINDLLNRLQESFGIQSRFIANASHELSTPLTSVSAQLEIALQKERSQEGYIRVMRSVYEDVQQLNQLTRALLDIAAAGGTAEGLQFEPVRIDELLMELPREIRKTDERAMVQLAFAEFPEEEDRLTVPGNRELLLCALRNITANACKYSEDKTASVALSFADGDIIISVKDQGQGIPEAELKAIFQPFYRGPGGEGKPGFGLGLSLSNRIAHLHKGHITVSSRPGEGSEFIITLPSSLKGLR